MKSPQVHCILNESNAPIIDYLRNIGALAADYNNANIILTDDIFQLSKGRLCFLIAEEPVLGHIHIPVSASHQQIYETILQIVSAVQNFHKTEEDSSVSVSREEAAIVGGFARHFSHNVLNSLLVASSFLRQLKPLTDKSDQADYLWKIVSEKLRFIEELVNGYNDYNHVLTLKMTEEVDVPAFYNELIVSIANKTFEKAFSAYLSYYVNRYSMTYDLHPPSGRLLRANSLFLKLAFCYILKDTIQYLGADSTTVNFHVVTQSSKDDFSTTIVVKNASMPPEILNTMFKPWHHQMFAQSFDYWGLAIAHSILKEHGGTFTAQNTGKDLVYNITI